mmetsp:Transcript_10353/g.42097  ORF Transcript_10353/g.42097 Transcript_10353/m.42097 type:complete len:877 (+) Transcript_10353:64-2694(+)
MDSVWSVVWTATALPILSGDVVKPVQHAHKAMNYTSQAYEYDLSSYYNYYTDAAATLSWGGGILFVLGFDAVVALVAFLAFLYVRHRTLKEYEDIISLTGSQRKESAWKIKQFINKIFFRHSERKLEEPHGWLNWIVATLRVTDAQILENCGRDGYLYLSYQRYLVYALLLQTLVACPILLGVNIFGDNIVDDSGFGITTANHITAGSPLLWIHTGATVMISLLIACSIVLTVKSIRAYASLREVAWSARLFTAKISNFPLKVTDPQLLQDYFDEAYPNEVLQCYICFDLNKLKKLYKKLRTVEAKIQHYEVLWSTSGERPMIHSNPITRAVFCNAICKPTVDALHFYYHKKRKLERKIEVYHEKEREQITTGVCFVTFYGAEKCRAFIVDFEERKNVPVTSLDRELETSYWRVQRAPQYEDIRWGSLHVHTPEYFVRFIIVNAIVVVGLFFFTTPIAMLGAVEEYTDNFDLVNTTLSWLASSSTIGSLIVAYMPSLLLLLLTFILPHILFFTTKLEGYHTRNAQNRAGLYKVFLYQIVAILILPSLALTSLEALAALSLDELESEWENGGLFPDGAVFVEYVIQAALLANACDIWRGPELLLQFLYKSKAVTKEELEDAEEVPPFKFGYEYQYFLIVFSVTLFYSVVVPVIVPCGFAYLAGKHFIDKYNLVYYYPKAPSSSNKLTQIAIILTMISLGLFQFTMSIYFYFYKAATLMAIIVVICSLMTFATGVYVNFIYFAKLKVLRNQQDGLDDVSGEIFRDAYLHPCFIEQRRRAQAREEAGDEVEDGVPSDLRDFVGSKPTSEQSSTAIGRHREEEGRLELDAFIARETAAEQERREFAARQGLDINSGLEDVDYLDTPALLDIPANSADDEL